MIVKTVLLICASLVSVYADCFNPGQAAGLYNAVIFGNYQGSSDVQGRIAVGGDADFANAFSVGDQLTNIGQCR